MKNQARHPKQGDFLIDDKYLFEVGGKNKTFEQIADLPNSFLAVDDTEVGHGNRIPFGAAKIYKNALLFSRTNEQSFFKKHCNFFEIYELLPSK